MSDAQILDFCQKVDQQFVYDLLLSNCQHFAFTVASALVKEEHRTPVWDLLFGSRDEQLSVLMKLTALEIKDAALFAQIMHQHDSSTLGGDGGVSASSMMGGFSGGDLLALYMHYMDMGFGGYASFAASGMGYHGGY